MQPLNGLNTNTRPLEQPEGTYPYGKNGLQYDLKGAIRNEDGFKFLPNMITPYTPNGVIETDDKPIICSTDDVNSAIGYFDPVTESYIPIFNDATTTYKLGFKREWYIIGQAQRNYKGEIVCAITDKHSFPKYFNADNLSVSRLEDWNLFPYFKPPAITTVIEAGGRLALGTYYVAVRYQKNDGTITPFSPVSLGKTVVATDQDVATDKALVITVSNADPSYDFIIIAIISKIKGVTNAMELDPIPINTSGDTLFVYTGDNLAQSISLEEILIPPSIYDRVGTIGQLNDALYIADLRKAPEINDMQQYANICKVEFTSKLINAVGAPPEHIDGTEKGFMHQETYALYIRYRLVRGGRTKCFVIPGNTPTALQLGNSGEAVSGGFSGKVFQVEDTINTFNPLTFTGDTGIWQNQTERYPNTIDFDSTALAGRDLRNQLILHHRMPSTKWCKANLYSTETEYGKTKLDILGIKVSNIQIPAKYIGVIDGYEIFYAKRTTSNMTNYGQGLLLHGAVSRRDNDLGTLTGVANIYTTGGNWNSTIRARGGTNFDYNNDLFLRRDTFRFHAFDILLNKPGIKPTFFSNQLRLRKTGLNPKAMYQDGDDGNSSGNTATVYLLDYTDGAVTVTSVPNTQLARGIKNGGQYLPLNININKFINTKHENTFGGQLLGPLLPLNWGSLGWHTHNASGSQESPDVFTDFVETYLVNLMAIKPDIYLNYYSQTLITAGNTKVLTDNSPFYGGDTFVCDYTFHTYGRHEVDDTWGGVRSVDGKKLIHRFVCESTSNIHLRYEIPGNEYSKWYPHTTLNYGDNGAAYPEFYDRNRDPNQFGYSKDLNALNDLLATSIFYPFREDIVDFPYRIHRGGKLSRQTKFRSWRTFLPLDYYECQKNMGPIKHLEGMYDRLFIHHENSLFYTQDKAKLDTGLLSVTLGAGDIFQFEPQEAEQAKLGYGGSQHELACVRTPAGYVVIDSKQGEMYLLQMTADSSGRRGISLQPIFQRMERFLFKYLKVTAINPFIENGITVGWDQRYKRILLSVKNYNPQTQIDNSFTLSYNTQANIWAFYHDYVADFYFHTRQDLWSIKNSKFYKHNANKPGVYYNQEIPPKAFFIDALFKSDSDLILETVNWVTEIIDGNIDNSDDEQEWKTLTHISIWNSQQHTGRIALKEIFEMLQYETDRRTQGTWTFNDFRNILITRGVKFLEDILKDYALIPSTADINKPWYDKEIIEDKYFVVRFEFDNTSGKQIILHDVSVQAIKSDR